MSKLSTGIIIIVLILTFFVTLTVFTEPDTKPGTDNKKTIQTDSISRENSIPGNAVKITPKADSSPPIFRSTEWEDPGPVKGSINTAGVEDSPFVLPDGDTLYFFFTPDANADPSDQVADGVSGIWVSHMENGSWQNPERVWLQKSGKLALDGGPCVQNDVMWFVSTRKGYEGVNVFTAEKVSGEWKNWEYAGDRLMEEIQIGEVHIHGDNLYFHSSRSGGKGSLDIWVTRRNGDSWSDPTNIEAVNTSTTESQPFITSDGKELWFTRRYNESPRIFRSVKEDGDWSEPELIVSQLSGEPTLDDEGNLYFTHVFYDSNKKVEADIYVAEKK